MPENDTTILYRAVGESELHLLERTMQFAVLEGGLQVKHFGLNYEETLDFADNEINIDLVAIFEVAVITDTLRKVGEFINVDPSIFISGTVEVQAEHLAEFNEAIMKIEQIL